jgi:hypothetical protein
LQKDFCDPEVIRRGIQDAIQRGGEVCMDGVHRLPPGGSKDCNQTIRSKLDKAQREGRQPKGTSSKWRIMPPCGLSQGIPAG